jgi:5'-nucleotidase
VEALLPLGEVVVVAPDRQWSGAGRAMPRDVTGHIEQIPQADGSELRAYAVDASPAQAVNHAVLELAPRPIALVVSGINFGLNMGTDVTLSGTVGAALEAAAFGIPALAVSLEMDPAYHLSGDDAADYTVAMDYVRRFSRRLLTHVLPQDVDMFNINVPAGASGDTTWRLTKLSRRRYVLPVAPDRAHGQGRVGYKMLGNVRQADPNSDIWAVHVDHVVSVTPLSLDLTARANFDVAPMRFGIAWAAGLDMPELRPLLRGFLVDDFRARSLAGEPWLVPARMGVGGEDPAFDPELD